MVQEKQETIVACATGRVKSGISVIRVSGPHSLHIAQQITKKVKPFKPRSASFCSFYKDSGDIIDSGIVLYFKGPFSFTGEDIIEFQIHGSPYLVSSLIKEVVKNGAREALPGEFSQRAFLNGKVDLAQAEAICDLINSQSSNQAKAALATLSGVFSKKIDECQEVLESIRVQLEAQIDFSEQAIPTSSWGKIKNGIESLEKKAREVFVSAQRGLHRASGLHVVLAGAPNVGKSSLLNHLTQSETAIVTDKPGTTRDLVRASIDHNGEVIDITDTAGIRKSSDPIEKIGIQLAQKEVKNADVVWVLADCREDSKKIQEIKKNIIQEETTNKFILVGNKVDTCDEGFKGSNLFDVFISAKHGQGVDSLLDITVKNTFPEEGGDLFSARKRHVKALECFLDHVVLSLGFGSDNLDMVAEELRLAQKELAVITGEYYSEDLLGAIFKNFCLGK